MTVGYKWLCTCGDNRHGSFNPDYEGRCDTQSRTFFTTQEKAKAGLDRHLKHCKFAHFYTDPSPFGCVLRYVKRNGCWIYSRPRKPHARKLYSSKTGSLYVRSKKGICVNFRGLRTR